MVVVFQLCNRTCNRVENNPTKIVYMQSIIGLNLLEFRDKYMSQKTGDIKLFIQDDAEADMEAD